GLMAYTSHIKRPNFVVSFSYSSNFRTQPKPLIDRIRDDKHSIVVATHSIAKGFGRNGNGVRSAGNQSGSARSRRIQLEFRVFGGQSEKVVVDFVDQANTMPSTMIDQ